MTIEKEKEYRKITVKIVLHWIFLLLAYVFGFLFLLAGLGIIIGGSYIAGALIVLFSIMIIPLFNRITRKLFQLEISWGVRVLLVILILILFAISIPLSDKGDIKSESKEDGGMSIDEIKETAIENISYDELLRNNERYVGRIVYYRGEITQVMGVYGDRYVLRVSVTKKGVYWADTIWVNYKGKRVLEGDIIDIWGKVNGLKAYTAVLGNQVTIPEIDLLHIELVEKAE